MPPDERSPAPALSRWAILEGETEPHEQSVTLETILIAADELRRAGAQGALVAIMGIDRARELGIEDGQVLERGRRYTYARIDHEVPPGTIMVSMLFPDPREAVRQHAASAAEGR